MRTRSVAITLLTLAALSSPAAPPSKKARIAVLMYGNKAEFVQLMQTYGSAAGPT